MAFASIASSYYKEVNPYSMGSSQSYHYNRYTALNFVVAVDVVVFAYSIFIIIANLLVTSKAWNLKSDEQVVSRGVMRQLVPVLDLLLLILLFGAATAAAGLRSTFSDLTYGAGCSINRAFCRKLDGACGRAGGSGGRVRTIIPSDAQKTPHPQSFRSGRRVFVRLLLLPPRQRVRQRRGAQRNGAVVRAQQATMLFGRLRVRSADKGQAARAGRACFVGPCEGER